MVQNKAVAGGVGTTSEPAVVVRGLMKSYGAFEAVRGIDFEIARGEIFALLGPNGAGKTTTVEILEGYRNRNGGEVRVLGHDPGRDLAALKPHMGIVLQSTGVEPFLTVRETVAMYAGYYPHPRDVDEVLSLVDLTEKAGARCRTLSGGQKRRLDLGLALVGNPELIFLDEPTTGFDPNARREAWDVVKDLAALGKTVVLTTHFMDEAQYLADRVVVISAGRIVAEGPPSLLGNRDHASTRIRYRLPEGYPADGAPGGTPGPDGWVEMSADDPVQLLHELTGWALERGIELDGLEVSRPSLEDVYLALTSSGSTHA